MAHLRGELAERLGIGEVSSPGAPITGVTRDSRKVGPGVVFVAIEGANVDGHRFVGGLPEGSVAIVRRRVPEATGVEQWVVADTKGALADAAAWLHGDPSHDLPVVGVTGTNGKTTVVTLVQQAMEALGRSWVRIGTTGVFGAGIDEPGGLTTPEAPALQARFRRLVEHGAEGCAMEVSSIGLDQKRVDGIRFHTAVFTNLQRDHLDFHGTMEAYARSKSRLFTELLRPAGGMPRAILWGDDPAWAQMHPPEDRWLYGESKGCDLRMTDVVVDMQGVAFDLHTPHGTTRLQAPLLGHHNALNLAAAAGILLCQGLSLEETAAGLARVTGPAGRMQRVALAGGSEGPVVVVDYAHTPDALQHAIGAVRTLAQGRVWVVFGCGGDRDKGKRPLMGEAALSADRVVVTSDNPRSEAPEAILADIVAGLGGQPHDVLVDRRQAIGHAVRGAAPGDVVLVAGKGHETTQEIMGTKHPFDDVAVAAACLEER